MTPTEDERVLDAYCRACINHYLSKDTVGFSEQHHSDWVVVMAARAAVLARMQKQGEEAWLVNYPGEHTTTYWTKNPEGYVVPESTVQRVRMVKVNP